MSGWMVRAIQEIWRGTTFMEARILSVADVVEAMASHRPYRAGLGIDSALDEIENRGIFYDINVVDACLRLFREKGFQLERTRY
jgi:HD-GYP domain-containing protein (c-di-GMP phosphodiesterase class II)